MFFRTIFDNANLLERSEDRQLMDTGVEIAEGNVKKVLEGLRPEIVKYAEHDSDRFEVFNDIHGTAKVVNTSIYEDADLDVIKQDFVPNSFFEGMLENGLDHAVAEVVRIEESFLENGYVYRDLKPDNIRFHNEVGMAVDYLDRLSVQTLDEVDDIETALAKSYDLFITDLSDTVYGLDPVEVERIVDRHSNYTEAWALTGEPYIDFEYTGNL